ncbi:MAG TPA: polysaccharide biosynthesis/export family protein, partial [Candidatus Tectomicrobia bacterium]
MVVFAGITLTACSGVPSRQTVPLTSPDALPKPEALNGAGLGDGRGTAALNKRLLSQMAQQPPDTDLPLGAGDIIEISVLEVDELSKFRARIPLRGAITLPLLGPLVAANRTAIELEEDIRQRLR